MGARPLRGKLTRESRQGKSFLNDAILSQRRRISLRSAIRPTEIGVGPAFLDWLTDPKLNGGGALMDFGCYGANLMTWLMNGRRPISVRAVTQQLKSDPAYAEVDDEATVLVTYPEGLSSLENNMIVTQILDAARRSAETGKTVYLELESFRSCLASA